MKQRTKESKKRLNSLILLVAFSAILLIASTYAWFAAQRDVTISNIEGKVEVSEGLEISLNAEDWGQEIDLSKLSLTTDAYSGNTNYEPTELIPASTLGTAGESGQKALKFYRGTAAINKNDNDIQEVQLTNIAKVDEGTAAGYFAFDIFLKNSTKGEAADKIYLTKKSTATVLQAGSKFTSRQGIDTTGLQNTVRVALAHFNGEAAITDNATTILSKVNATDSTITRTAIWEPNSNFHVDYIVQNFGNVLKVPDTFTGLTDSKITKTSKIATYALNDGWEDAESADDKKIANAFDWSSTGSGVSKQNVLQTQITVPASGMPTSYEMTETAGADTTGLVLASDGSTKFDLPANTVTKARVYIWLEGQDIDCQSYASAGGGIEINLGLEKPVVE